MNITFVCRLMETQAPKFHCPQCKHMIRVAWSTVFTIVDIENMRRKHFNIYVNLAEVDYQQSPSIPASSGLPSTIVLSRALIDIIIL